MSQGIDHIFQVVNATSWDEKREIIMSQNWRNGCEVFRPWESMSVWHRQPGDDPWDLEPLTPGQMDELWPPKPSVSTGFVGFRGGDVDEGPYRAWRMINADFDRWTLIMHPEAKGARARAYVFWDHQHLVEHRLLPLIKTYANAEEDEDTTMEEWHEEQWSFMERSEVWSRGGRGYWSAGDLSRIQWPSQEAGRQAEREVMEWREQELERRINLALDDLEPF